MVGLRPTSLTHPTLAPRWLAETLDAFRYGARAMVAAAFGEQNSLGSCPHSGSGYGTTQLVGLCRVN